VVPRLPEGSAEKKTKMYVVGRGVNLNKGDHHGLLGRAIQSAGTDAEGFRRGSTENTARQTTSPPSKTTETPSEDFWGKECQVPLRSGTKKKDHWGCAYLSPDPSQPPEEFLGTGRGVLRGHRRELRDAASPEPLPGSHRLSYWSRGSNPRKKSEVLQKMLARL